MDTITIRRLCACGLIALAAGCSSSASLTAEPPPATERVPTTVPAPPTPADPIGRFELYESDQEGRPFTMRSPVDGMPLGSSDPSIAISQSIKLAMPLISGQRTAPMPILSDMQRTVPITP